MTDFVGDPNAVFAGVARSDITPPVGTPLIGSLRETTSRGVDRPLTATALVVTKGDSCVAIISCDLVLVTPEEARLWRERIGRRLGVGADKVLLNVSHSHATPGPPSFHDYEGESDDTSGIVERYFSNLADQIVGTAEEANGCLRPVRVGVSAGSVAIGVNRREELDDGTIILGEDPSGPIDPTVGVVRLDLHDGRPLAALVHYACHPDVLGPKADLISPDYVGATRTAFETVTGATMLFLQGAGGDIDPRCGLVMGEDGIIEMNRLGLQLGCEAARVFETINTTRRRSRRVAWVSAVSTVTAWEYEDVTSESSPPVGAAVARLRLPLRALPPLHEAASTVTDTESALRDLLARPSTVPDRLVARRRLRWARLQLEAVAQAVASDLEVEIQVVRIGPFTLVGIPGEPFVEIGLKIKALSPLSHTYVSGYSNGSYFYIPTADAYLAGGYEIDSNRNYLRPAGPTPDWEDAIVKSSLALVGRVAA